MIDINKAHTVKTINYYFIEKNSNENFLITIDSNKNQHYVDGNNNLELDTEILVIMLNQIKATYYQITKQIFDSLREMSEELRKELMKSYCTEKPISYDEMKKYFDKL